MRRARIAGAAAFIGYLVGAFGGGYLISVFSTNMHDRSVEAATTGAFVCGPLGAIVAFVAGMYFARRRM